MFFVVRLYRVRAFSWIGGWENGLSKNQEIVFRVHCPCRARHVVRAKLWARILPRVQVCLESVSCYSSCCSCALSCKVVVTYLGEGQLFHFLMFFHFLGTVVFSFSFTFFAVMPFRVTALAPGFILPTSICFKLNQRLQIMSSADTPPAQSLSAHSRAHSPRRSVLHHVCNASVLHVVKTPLEQEVLVREVFRNDQNSSVRILIHPMIRHRSFNELSVLPRAHLQLTIGSQDVQSLLRYVLGEQVSRIHLAVHVLELQLCILLLLLCLIFWFPRLLMTLITAVEATLPKACN